MTGASRGSARSVRRLLALLAVLLCVGGAGLAVPAAAQDAGAPGCAADETADACLVRALSTADSAFRHAARDGDLGMADRDVVPTVQLLRDVCGRGMGDGCYFAGRVLLTRFSMFEWEAARVDSVRNESAALFRAGCLIAPGNGARPSGAACSSLGDAFGFGIGLKIDADSAIAYYHRGCSLGDATACAREAGHLASRPEYGPERPVVARRLSLLACELGSPGGCASVAAYRTSRLAETPPERRQSPAFVRERTWLVGENRRLCGEGVLTACAELGRILSDRRFGIASDDSARHYYRLGCRGEGESGWIGVGMACRGAAALALVRNPPDTAEAMEFYRIGCVLFDADSCADLGRMPRLASDSSGSTYARLDLFMSACMATTPSSAGCRSAGGVFERELADTAQARSFYGRACELADGQGCGRMAVLADSVHDDDQTALKYYRRGCGLRHGSSCTGLAALLAGEHGDQARADRLYALGCELGDAGGCWHAMLARRRAGDEVQEGLVRARACRLDRSFCKNQELRLDEP